MGKSTDFAIRKTWVEMFHWLCASYQPKTQFSYHLRVIKRQCPEQHVKVFSKR